MSLVSLRKLTDSPNAPAFDDQASPTRRMFAEDYNRIRDAIQTAIFGIKTRSLETVDDGTIGKDLIVGRDISGRGLTLTSSGNFGGGLVLGGNLVVSGSVDGITDLLGHTHGGGSDGSKIPLSSLVGASLGAEWAAHDHATDGSPQVNAGGIADQAITFAKVETGAFGLGATSIARGDHVANTRSRMESFLAAATQNFSPFWIPAHAMVSLAGTDTAPTLVEDDLGSVPSPPGYFLALDFSNGDAARFSFPMPAGLNTVVLNFVYYINAALVADITMTTEVFQASVADPISGSAVQTQRTVQQSPSVATDTLLVEEAFPAITPSVSPSSTGEVVNVRFSIASNPADHLYLVGAWVDYDLSNTYGDS